MSSQNYIACDLGADSGRVILGSMSGGKLSLDEVHRFRNGPLQVADSLRWNILSIYAELLEGLMKVGRKNLPIAGVSVDSWGVDYVYLGAGQPMLGLPHHYRDARTDTTFQELMNSVGRSAIFEETGIQFMSLNSIYQFVDDRKRFPKFFELADQFLGIADYLGYLFSGVAKTEESYASTTQIYNPQTRQWSENLIDRLGLPKRVFPEVVPSGTLLGPLRSEIAARTGLEGVRVIAGCSHDTGAAVAATPGEGEDWAYLSSGTWSLMGVELAHPLISEKVLEHNFTNEIGYGGSIRFLKNLAGMWLVQESRRAWEKEGAVYSFDELDQMALACEPLRSIITPNAPIFAKPGGMPEKIKQFCSETGQPVPQSVGEIMRCTLDSLALSYRMVLDDLESLTGRVLRRVHVVGGGSKNSVLNQLTADATGRKVLAGPVEATAIGNCLIQALALGEIDSLESLRRVVRNSFAIKEFQPSETARWEGCLDRLRALEKAYLG